MGSKIRENKDYKFDVKFHNLLSQIVQPFSSLFIIKEEDYIYSGEETIPFSQRHPTFKSLMKLEFQDVLCEFERK
jgi:hypothetical protein